MDIKPATFKPLKTKLSPPNITSNRLVMRKALRVADYHDWLHKVVNVLAPAGFGKSTLLWQWYQQIPSNIGRAWLNIDKQDNDSLRLIRYIASAYQQAYQQDLETDQSLLTSAENVPVDYLLDALLRETEQREKPLLLFIDDAHLVTKKNTLALMKELLHRAPPYIGFVLSGRSRVRAHLSRLKVSRRLLEVNVTDLNFNKAEIRHFFSRNGNAELTDQQLSAVGEKTEGWVAGMQLIALASQSKSIDQIIPHLSGSFADIADYLGELVFQQQSPDLQSFLLKSAVLDRFNVSLCNAIIGEDKSHQYLLLVKAKQLFLISLDRNNEWYRYHPLFQDYLRQYLRNSNYKDYQECLAKASKWHEEEGLTTEAINYALKGKLYNQAAYLLSEYGLEIRISQFNYGDFQKWFEQIPKNYFRKWPLMTLCAAYHELDMVNYRKANYYIELVDKWLLMYESAPDSHFDFVNKVIMVRDTAHLLALSFYGDSEELFAEYQRWQEKYPNLQEHYALIVYSHLAGRYSLICEYQLVEKMALRTAEGAWKLKIYIGFTWANIKRVLVSLKQAKLLKAQNIVDTAIKKLEKEGILYFKRFLYPIMSHIKWEQGNIDQAEHYLQLSSIKSIEKLNSCTLTALVYIVAAKLAWLEKNYQQAEELLSEGQEKILLPRLFFQVISERYRQLAFKQDINKMLELQEFAHAKKMAIEFPIDEVRANIDEVLQIMQIRLLIIKKELTSALNLLIVLLRSFTKQKRCGDSIRLLVVKANILHQLGDDQATLLTLKEMFLLAIPSQIIMPIIEEGYAISELINESLQQLSKSFKPSEQYNYYQRIQGLLNRDINKNNQESKRRNFYDTLTEREIIILQNLDSLLTREQLADKLDISVNTLKWHLRNLYQKLQATNRHTAIIQAKNFGLL